MLVDDSVLPAAAHLTGPDADRILDAALDAVGGRLERARACHLQYRPGHDVVVRFHSRVRWGPAAPVDETLVVATTSSGPPPDTLPVEAELADGTVLSVGVWRWPFDPLVVGLAAAVTPTAVAEVLDGLAVGRVRLEVLAYRPTLRAVVRAVDDAGTTFYVKALRPQDVPDIVGLHERLGAAGLPVPVILRHDAPRGLLVMAELEGPTIRDRLKRGRTRLPDADEYERIATALAPVALPGRRRVESRAETARHHAAVLTAVLPGERGRLDRLVDALGPAAVRAGRRSGPTIHGDLYEAQLVTGCGAGRTGTITGVLDLDDVGPGDPIDDRATVVAHLIDRALDADGAAQHRILGYARSLRRSFGTVVDPVELDLVTAGALVGLATGPFRMQRRGWPAAVRRRLVVAERLADRPGEKTLTVTS